MNFDIAPFPVLQALLYWVVVTAAFAVIAFVVAGVLALITGGIQGVTRVFKGVAEMAVDFACMSPRRIWSLTQLTYKEALRRKAFYVFGVFLVLFMFAGWFLTGVEQAAEFQVNVYVSFVLRAISWLILPVVLLLACWGIPEDIRIRSLHTVVTKPVRRNEVVLGRMLGYTLVGTIVLAVMATVGYIWILRVTPEEAKGQLVARVPIYGELSFTDRRGDPQQFGINVGDVWQFRSYIEGATKSRAIWIFNGITKNVGRDGDGLSLESRFQAFRTHKGNMNRTLLYRYNFANPETGLVVPGQPITVDEFRANVIEVPRELTKFDPDTGAAETYDLFDDLVTADGKLKIEVEAIDAGQYLGMARPDLFIRTPDRPFAVTYWKAILGQWLMMVLIIVIGVTASTFVKGPVATLLTACMIAVGQGFRQFMGEIVSGQFEGGGVLESIYRIIMHLNPTTAMPEGVGTTIIKSIDQAVTSFLWLVQFIIPSFDHFQMLPYTAKGFDVPWNAALLPSIAVTLGFFIPCLFIGYFALRGRELEAK